MAHIEPKTSVLNSVRHQRFHWKTILGEFIDNAFDANATRVQFAWDKKQLKVTDDGSGCADVLKMLTLGDRENHSSTQLGCYGIGAKDAAISAADGITIISSHRGMRRAIFCNWKNLEKSGVWEIDDPTEEPTVEPSGTTIVLSPTRMERPAEESQIIKALSQTYTPAIRSGRQIVLQLSPKRPSIVVPEWQTPPLEHQITADLDIDGKRARVTMGIVPEGYAVECGGLVISYGYRVIIQSSRVGLGDAPTPNLVGSVELGDGWELTKNKDNISSNMKPLGDAIYAACRETIERAAKQATNVLFDGVAKAVNDALDKLVTDLSPANKKAKRKSPTVKNDPKAPTGNGSPHKRAAVVQAGNTFSGVGGGKLTSIRVAFRNMGENGPASRFEDGMVYLNRDIPVLAEKMNDPESVAVHAIYSASAWLATNEGPQMRLFQEFDAPTVNHRMAIVAGMLLSRMRTRDTPALRAVS